ncbi:MAG: kinase/pyrophosphorylase [candidate division Zixibacteria bacterium]|nr:kinase/pyrophosphorylase [candidate division Zixibacteria bacterium]
MDDTKKIVVISDGTGQTAKRLMDAVLSQYAYKEIEYTVLRTYQEVRGMERCDEILDEIDDQYLVVFSVISRGLSQYLHEKLHAMNILHLNVLKPMVSTMSKFLGVHPDFEPGLLQRIDDRYYKKIDAIGFTVEHDDGRGMLIEEADVVLLGASRTCKTPISMYLACNHGVKAANIPIFPTSTMEQYILTRLKSFSQNKVFGLMMQPDTLVEIRQERSHHLAHTVEGRTDIEDYFDVHKIREELRFCRHLFAVGEWKTIDVTRRAIEEISDDILEILRIERA